MIIVALPKVIVVQLRVEVVVEIVVEVVEHQTRKARGGRALHHSGGRQSGLGDDLLLLLLLLLPFNTKYLSPSRKGVFTSRSNPYFSGNKNPLKFNWRDPDKYIFEPTEI